MADFFIIHREAEFVARVKAALVETTGHKVLGSCESGKEGLFLLNSTKANVVLVQLALDDMDGLRVITQLVQKFPDICVVPVLEGTEGGDVWQKILQLNLRTVINGPSDVATLTPLLKQAAQTAGELAAQVGENVVQRGNSYLIAVAGARSGLGKTVFATNLVVAMQAYEADVALIDLSMNPGDFFTCLDYVPRHTLVDAVKARDQLDATYLSNLLAQHPLGFKFLACPNQDMDPNDFYGFSHEDAIQFIQLCRSTAQFVILDTGVHDLPFSVASVEEADLVFMVTTRDLARLLSLQRMLKGLKDRGLLMEKIKVIVNNAEVGVELSDAEVETVLEHPVTAYLPSIPAQTTFSINSGNPLAQSKPELPFCAVIQRLAEISLHRWLDEEDQG